MLGYTWAQFSGYLRAANRAKRERQRAEMLASAIGFAGGDALKRALAALDQADRADG